MGHSTSIGDLQNQNQAFSDYMASATKNLKLRADDQRKPFLDSIATYYVGKDQQLMGSGSNTDYRQSAEFSLDSISKVMNDVADAVFQNATPPAGTVVTSSDQISKAVTTMAGFETLALLAAKSFITDILGAFDTGASTAFHSAYSSRSLAPGLMLHVWNYGDSFQKSDFFNNECIIETVIEFQLIYSFAEAKVMDDIDYMNTHSQSIEDLDSKILGLQNKIDAKVANIDVDLPPGQPAGWESRIVTLKKTLEEYRTEVATLVTTYKPKATSPQS